MVRIFSFFGHFTLISLYKSFTFWDDIRYKIYILQYIKYSCSYYNGNYLCEDIDWLYKDINNNLLDMKVNILYDICFCIINKKLRQAFADCGQLSYVSLFDKYLADVANLYNE